MTKPNLKTLIDLKRVQELEGIIYQIENLCNVQDRCVGVPRALIHEIAHLKVRLSEYKLEYRERTGKDYQRNNNGGDSSIR